jgi:hypothetical protein
MPVSGAENYGMLAGALKEVLNSGISQIIPDHCIVQRLTPFDGKAKQVGLQYVEPVRTKRPAGFTFAQAGTGPYNYNTPRAGKVERAMIQANNVHLIEILDKEMMFRTLSTEAAVKQATAIIVEAMMEAARNVEEINLLYGQTDLGQVAASGNVSTVSGATQLVVSAATWGPALWMGSENMPLEIFDSAAIPLYFGPFTVQSVTPESRIVLLDQQVTTALQAATFPLQLWRAGTRQNTGTTTQAFNEAAGLKKILSNTGALFNIDASKNTLWKSIQFDNGSGPLAYNSWVRASSLACVKGTRSGAVALVPVDSWADLAINEAAYRKWDDPSGSLKVGPDALVFVGATGTMAIKAHPMLKRGDAFLINVNATSGTPGGDYKRIGATDWTFETAGPDDVMLHYLPDMSGLQIELYHNKALLVDPPGRSLLIKNIVDTQNY